MSRPALVPAPNVADAPAPTPLEELEAKAKALEATFPNLHRQGRAEGWPSGVSPQLCHGLKRVERWRAGDERPVVVLQRADRKCFAKVGEAGQADGLILPLKSLAPGRAP